MWWTLLRGFPGRTSRGYLGWSTVTLLRSGDSCALFDTGGWGDRPGLFSGLSAHGIQPDQVTHIVLSHLHFDHIGNVECFPRADVILHESELAYYRAEQFRDLAIPRYQVEGLLGRARLHVVKGEPEILPGIRMIETPGHTGGHCSLVLTDSGRTVVLAQDAVKTRLELAGGLIAGAFDPDRAAASVMRIRAMADLVIPGHDGPLSLKGDEVLVHESPEETLTLTTDAKSIRLEA